MTGRKKLTPEEKLAAALLMITDGHGKPVIDPEWAKTATAKDICAQFEMDHNVHVAIGGTNHPSNIVPRLVADHKKKTASTDIPQIAKTKRVAKDFEAFRAKLLAKTVTEPADETPLPKKNKHPSFKSRPMDGTKSSGLRKKMNGKVERRP